MQRRTITGQKLTNFEDNNGCESFGQKELTQSNNPTN